MKMKRVCLFSCFGMKKIFPFCLEFLPLKRHNAASRFFSCAFIDANYKWLQTAYGNTASTWPLFSFISTFFSDGLVTICCVWYGLVFTLSLIYLWKVPHRLILFCLTDYRLGDMQFLILTKWLYVTAGLKLCGETVDSDIHSRGSRDWLSRVLPFHRTTHFYWALWTACHLFEENVSMSDALCSLSLFLCHSCSLVSLSSPRLARSVPFFFFPILTTSSLKFFTRSLDPPSRLLLKHFPHPLHVCLLVLPFQVHLPFSPSL